MKSLLIYNKNSGKGRIVRDLHIIEDFFKVRQWNLILFEVIESMDLKLEVEKIANEYELILIAGGDGTIHSVINGLMALERDLRPKVMFLPYGTTNDVSTMLGMSKDIYKTLKILDSNSYAMMDIHKANETYFIYAAAIGKFSKISYEINRKSLKFFGSIGYFINTLTDLFNHYQMDVQLKVNDEYITKKAFLIILAAGTRVAGFNLSKFSKNNKLNSGLIGVRIFTRNHILSWFKMVWFYLFQGRHFKNDLHLDVSKIEFRISDKYTWNIDGEKGPKGNLKISVLKEEITVYINEVKKDTYFI